MRCLRPALGSARGGYADFVHGRSKRYLTYTQLNIAQHVPVQLKVAEIAAQIDAAELLARRALATGARRTIPACRMETRTLLRRDFTYAMRMLRDAMDDLVKISGSSGLMDDNPMQRCWRDVHAISSHVVMNWDVPAENFGRDGIRPGAQSGLSDVLIARPSIPAPHAVGVAVLHLRRDIGRLAVADGAEHGDPVQQLAADIAGLEHAMLRRLGDQCVDLLLFQQLDDARRPSGSGTPSERPGAMRGPPTSSEKLPLPMTTTRSGAATTRWRAPPPGRAHSSAAPAATAARGR